MSCSDDTFRLVDGPVDGQTDNEGCRSNFVYKTLITACQLKIQIKEHVTSVKKEILMNILQKHELIKWQFGIYWLA